MVWALGNSWNSIFNPAVDEARALIARAGLRSLHIEWREDVKKWHPGQDWVWVVWQIAIVIAAIAGLGMEAPRSDEDSC